MIMRGYDVRDEAQKRFLQIWSDYLPADIAAWREKIVLSLTIKRKS
jgi:hypothetical protein